MASLRIIVKYSRLFRGLFQRPPLEGGAHDSGRAWSSLGLLVAAYILSVKLLTGCLEIKKEFAA